MTREQLLARQSVRVVRRPADLPPTDDVMVLHTGTGETGHRTTDRRTAVCGAEVAWCIGAYRLTVQSGQLCPACWPPHETPAGNGPAGDERTR